MGFGDLVGFVNGAALDTFGDDFAFTRVNSLPAGEELTVTGILDAGFEPEDRPPGDGSTYARLWLQTDDLSPVPERGDEIASATTVYKIVRLQEDAGNGLWLLLRQDRVV